MKEIILTFLVLFSISTFGQKKEKERFPGEFELKDCKVKVDLYYSTKRNADLMKSVEKYKDTELALVTIDKKKGVTYTCYFLVGAETSLGPTAYLVEPKFLEENSKNKFWLFLRYKPKKHIFYDAKCFRGNPVIKDLKYETVEFSDID